MGKGSYSNAKYSPTCQRCFRVIRENSPGSSDGHTGLHFRKSLSVCKSCQEKLDSPKHTKLDDEYKKAYLKHTLGDTDAVTTR